METLEQVTKRIEAPLAFAAGGICSPLARIKNLGKTMTTMLEGFRGALERERSHLRSAEIDNLLNVLTDLFKSFDVLLPEEKRKRLAEAIQHVDELKATLKKPPRALQDSSAPSTEPGKGSFLLFQSVQSVQGIGSRIAALLARKNIATIEDMLHFLPRRYEDRRTISRITETLPNSKHTIVGKVTFAEMHHYGRRRIFEITVDDGYGFIKAKWFKGREAFLRDSFQPGRRVILTGLVSVSPFAKEMIHPDFELIEDNEDRLVHFKRIIPIYPEVEGLQPKTVRRLMWHVVRDYADFASSLLPEEVRQKRNLIDNRQALRQVHFPTSDQSMQMYAAACSEAHRRLIYDELFFLQLEMAWRRGSEICQPGIRFRPGGEMLKRFFNALPFDLTSAQKRVIQEIERDMTAASRMSRLLQGDVGCGKTVVAMAALIIACENGYQTAVMAPTEILAEQHYRTLQAWSEQIGLKTALLTGGVRNGEKDKFHASLMSGEINIAVGTHALIQEKTTFRHLGLVVVDEQHRFGVVQRAALINKGTRPDVLVMTATPIPRTLAMTVYGDMDISVIDEVPPGRKSIPTKVVTESQRNRVYETILRETQKGHQIFIVYPIVEESDHLDLKDATHMAEHLQKEIFPQLRIGLLHGRLKVHDKNRILEDFLGKKIQILVSTTVIELGIDVPQASLMVVEHAERFGLSQLHQLRGRVGRGDTPSSCILMARRNGAEIARKRLKIMEETSDGFRIAEEDLALRGPGEFMGTRQSGLPDFWVADLFRDANLLDDARRDAFSLLEEDPQLLKPPHLPLRELLLHRRSGRTSDG